MAVRTGHGADRSGSGGVGSFVRSLGNMGGGRSTVVAALVAALGLSAACGGDGDSADGGLPAEDLLDYGPEAPTYVAVADAITEAAHFGPTGLSTEDGEPMITVVRTTQDRDALRDGLEEDGWMPAGDDTYTSDALRRAIGSANWVHVGEDVVIWAPHERHLDVALDGESRRPTTCRSSRRCCERGAAAAWPAHRATAPAAATPWPLVAMVITADGTKIPVGLVLGDTENTVIVKDLLADLVATAPTRHHPRATTDGQTA